MSQWDDALAIARRLNPVLDIALAGVQAFNNVQGALESLQQAEHDVSWAQAKLATLARLGLAVEEDFANFDVMRTNLFASQLQMWIIVTQAAGQLPGGATIISRIPVPVMSPAMSRPRNMPRPLEAVPQFKVAPMKGTAAVARPSGVSGFGVTPAAAAGAPAAAILANPFFWVAAVLVVIAGLAVLAYALYGAAEAIASIVVTVTQGSMFRTLAERRVQTYQACLDNGGARAECLTAAQLVVPTPEEAGVDPTSPYDANGYRWVFWTLAATAAGAGLFLFFRSDLGKAVVAKGATNLRGLGAPTRVYDLDGSQSTYNLEIEG